MYEKYLKRSFDIVISTILIIVLLPVYILVSIAILLNMGCPILFKQERIGYKERRFTMYKFRSMRVTDNKVGNICDDQNRLTKLGIFLRSTSLDELPELFNVLKGDMSFVGPRPFPSYYLPYYTEKERARHNVRGGLIPCDGILGSANVTWEEQFEAELNYVDNVSFKMDLKILIKTLKILLQRAKSEYGKIERPLLNEIREGQNDK